jgi:Fe-S-cluster containining protein
MIDALGHELDFGTSDGLPPRAAHCCRMVFFAHTFQDFARSYDAVEKGLETYTREDGTVAPVVRDVLTIGPMIRMVGVVDHTPTYDEMPRGEPRKLWRCIHANESNDYLCDIYERRPHMCRLYPANAPDGKCEFHRCQSTRCPDHPSKVQA